MFFTLLNSTAGHVQGSSVTNRRFLFLHLSGFPRPTVVDGDGHLLCIHFTALAHPFLFSLCFERKQRTGENTGQYISREKEKRVLRLLAANKLGKEVLATFEVGRIDLNFPAFFMLLHVWGGKELFRGNPYRFQRILFRRRMNGLYECICIMQCGPWKQELLFRVSMGIVIVVAVVSSFLPEVRGVHKTPPNNAYS